MRVDKAAYLKDTCKVLLLSKLDEKIIFNINIEYMKSCLLNLAFFFFFFFMPSAPLTPALECRGKAFRVACVSSPVLLVKCACPGRSK